MDPCFMTAVLMYFVLWAVLAVWAIYWLARINDAIWAIVARLTPGEKRNGPGQDQCPGPNRERPATGEG